MISKLFVFILTLFIAANANVSISCEPRLNKVSTINDGFYGGLGLGYSTLVGQLNRTLNFQISDRVISIGEKGLATGIFAGYQKIFDRNLYIAVEGFYQYANIVIEKEENSLPGYINYFMYMKNNHKGGIAAKIGFVHCNNVFYLKSGIALSRFALTFRNQNYLLNPKDIASIHRVQKGILIGGGIDYFINKNFGIGIEYEVINYPAIMNIKIDTAGGFSFKPTAHTFNLRFKYTL